MDEGRPGRTVLPSFGRMLWRHRGEPGMLIPLLQAAQDAYGYIPALAIEQISGVTGIPQSEVFGVITFYRQFRLSAPGQHLIRVCKGTACHVLGANLIAQTIEEELGVAAEETTPDGLYTFTEVACLGCCSLAPVIMIGEQTFGRLTPQRLRSILRKHRRQCQQHQQRQPRQPCQQRQGATAAPAPAPPAARPDPRPPST